MIVGFGEVDEGAFPSLAIGATKLLFEDLYEEAKIQPSHSTETLETYLTKSSPESGKIRKQYTKNLHILNIPFSRRFALK